MRDMTERELDLLLDGKCPLCAAAHTKYIPGPCGGAAQNITTECGGRINIPHVDMAWPPVMRFGQVIDQGPCTLPPEENKPMNMAEVRPAEVKPGRFGFLPHLTALTDRMRTYVPGARR